MSKIKDLKRNQKRVNKIIRAWNKSLKEDCFAGRFELKQINRLDYAEYNGMGFNTWYRSRYVIRFIDNEDHNRDVDIYFITWIDSLSDGYSYNFDNCRKQNENIACINFQPRSISEYLNEYIQQSNFWELWHNNQEYRNNHWYSGEELKEVIKFSGKEWAKPTPIKVHNDEL